MPVVSEDLKLVSDWIREPDYAESFSADDLSQWLDKRPIAAVARLTAALSDQVARPRAFLDWAATIFGPVALDRRERATRFLEEAIELAHAESMPVSLVEKLVTRVFASPQGDTPKELGQAQACLETFAESIGLSANDEAAREFDRVRTIPREEWTRRHQVKVARGIADVPAPPSSPAAGE